MEISSMQNCFLRKVKGNLKFFTRCKEEKAKRVIWEENVKQKIKIGKEVFSSARLKAKICFIYVTPVIPTSIRGRLKVNQVLFPASSSHYLGDRSTLVLLFIFTWEDIGIGTYGRGAPIRCGDRRGLPRRLVRKRNRLSAPCSGLIVDWTANTSDPNESRALASDTTYLSRDISKFSCNMSCSPTRDLLNNCKLS